MTRDYEILQSQKRVEARLEALIEVVQTLQKTIEDSKPKVPKYVYGIKGLAQLLGCSMSTAERIKRSGVLDGAIIQRNRSVIVDAQRALALFDDPDARYGYSRIRQRRK